MSTDSMSDVHKRIDEIVKSHPVVLFMKGPVAQSLPILPNTMVTTFTAVPLAMSGVILNSLR